MELEAQGPVWETNTQENDPCLTGPPRTPGGSAMGETAAPCARENKKRKKAQERVHHGANVGYPEGKICATGTIPHSKNTAVGGGGESEAGRGPEAGKAGNRGRPAGILGKFGEQCGKSGTRRKYGGGIRHIETIYRQRPRPLGFRRSDEVLQAGLQHFRTLLTEHIAPPVEPMTLLVRPPPHERTLLPREPLVPTIVFTDGSMKKVGENDKRVGFGVHFPADPSRDIAGRARRETRAPVFGGNCGHYGKH